MEDFGAMPLFPGDGTVEMDLTHLQHDEAAVLRRLRRRGAPLGRR